MMNLPSHRSQLVALIQPINAELKQVIRRVAALAYANNLADLTHMLIIEPGDAEADIIEAIGFTPLASRLDGKRGQPDWDLIEQHAGWWQLTYCIGNSGFAYILVVSKAAGTLPELQALCQRVAAP